MAGVLTGDQRTEVALRVWPEIATLGIGYLIGHGIIVECVLAGDKAPVDELTRARIVEEAAKVKEGKRP